jgi:small subunit ribosomal protein S16
MLAIRMQRTGRKGHAMFRVVVQDSRRTPTSGRIVAQLGSYDPHGKAIIIDKERAGFYLQHGAQPSDRVARLLKSEGVDLPAWVSLPTNKQRTVRHADKRRSTTPVVPVEEVAAAEVEEVIPPEVEAPAVEEETSVPTEETATEEAEVTEPEAEVDSTETKE